MSSATPLLRLKDSYSLKLTMSSSNSLNSSKSKPASTPQGLTTTHAGLRQQRRDTIGISHLQRAPAAPQRAPVRRSRAWRLSAWRSTWDLKRIAGVQQNDCGWPAMGSGWSDSASRFVLASICRWKGDLLAISLRLTECGDNDCLLLES